MKYDTEELLRLGMKGMKSRIEKSVMTGRNVRLDEYVDIEKRNIFYALFGTTRYSQKTGGDLIEEIESLEPQLLEKTKELELRCRKSLKLREISEACATAMVSAALDEAGYHQYRFVCQRYRIKVVVTIGQNVISLPLKFSAFPSIVEKVVPAVRDAERICMEFGRDTAFG